MANRVAIAHVERVALTVRTRPQQQVDTGLRQLGPDRALLQQRTREHQRLADPVGLVDDTEGERGLHIVFVSRQSSFCPAHLVQQKCYGLQSKCRIGFLNVPSQFA